MVLANIGRQTTIGHAGAFQVVVVVVVVAHKHLTWFCTCKGVGEGSSNRNNASIDGLCSC
jgi:hypothetical protein